MQTNTSPILRGRRPCRSLTPAELATAEEHVRTWGGLLAAARALGVDRETLRAALRGRPVQRRTITLIAPVAQGGR